MKIVVIGGTGLIGTKLVKSLTKLGHEAIAASPSLGINSVTTEGLAEALMSVDVVVDVSNAPSYEGKAAMDFFYTSGSNILDAEEKAGVSHHIALSVVGTGRLQESGYFQAKKAQEDLVKQSTIPYTIVQSTQFFERIETIAHAGIQGDKTHISPALAQPIGADDVAGILTSVTLGVPAYGTIEITGPESISLYTMVDKYFNHINDSRKVIQDANAGYFGAQLNDLTLMSGNVTHKGVTHFGSWLTSQP